jgi:tetratricopeptide (TPR) repeat protein
MPYKFRASKKNKQAIIPIQEIKGRFDLLKERFANRPLLTAGVITILAVVLISIPAYRIFTRQSEDRAWALEIEASRLFHEKQAAVSEADKKDATKGQTSMERLIKASMLYDDILNRYPASMAAVIAQFEGGNVYFELEKYDLAEKRYLAFLKKETAQKDLLPLVHLRLAYLYQKQKKDALALDHFRIAYEWEGGFNKDQAGYERGALLERIGKKDEAIETYKKVSEAFKDSPWGTEAKTRLAMLTASTATSTSSGVVIPAAATSMPPAVASMPAPVPAKFSPPTAVKARGPVAVGVPTSPKAAKITVPVVASPVVPREVTPKPVVVEMPTDPPVPTAPTTVAPSTPIPLQITPEQLRMLREKGSLTIPLPPQPEAEVAPVPEKKPEPIAP